MDRSMSYAELVDFFYAGQSVELKRPDSKNAGKVFQVTKVNPKNLNVKGPNGELLRGPHSIWQKTDKEFISTAPPAAALAPLKEGMLVRCTPLAHRKWNYPTDQLFCVTKFTDEKVSISRVGGEVDDNARGWTVSRAKVTPVTNFRVVVED